MKTVKIVLTLTVLLFASVHAFASPGFMHISLIEGDVQVKTTEADDWGPAAMNGPLMEGDQVWVPQGGRAELRLNSGSSIRLDENSSLQILSVDRDSSQFYLSQGHVYVFYDAPRGSVIQVDSPDASTHAFDRAIYRIDMSEQDQATDVGVYKGYVEAENNAGTTRINAGDMLTVSRYSDGETAPMGEPDEWEAWNKERNDRLRARREAAPSFLPPEMRVYSYDLESNGRWVNIAPYGNCWVPTVEAGWAPYRFGRWSWVGGDYVWISDEPWGWATYHYGRWAFVRGFGWCWAPPVAGEVYWSPGYVGWVRTGDYVAWVPLAPGEVYYGRGYYGPNSVNINTVHVNQVNVINVYKNVSINNGVTVVSRNTFATASPKIVQVNHTVIQNQIFVKNNISIGTPAIKPTRASFFMSAKQIPAAKLPPQTVRTIKPAQLKLSRPLVTQPGKSVLNPGAKPKPLAVKTVSTPRTPGMMSRLKQPGASGPGIRRPGAAAEARGRSQELKPQEKKTVAPEGGQRQEPERRVGGRDSDRQPRESGLKPQERRAEVPDVGREQGQERRGPGRSVDVRERGPEQRQEAGSPGRKPSSAETGAASGIRAGRKLGGPESVGVLQKNKKPAGNDRKEKEKQKKEERER